METLADGSTIGPYPFRIERRLGSKRGNMAAVYLASAHGPSAPSDYVAIKIAKVATQHGAFNETGLRNESDILSQLTHPSIVRIYPVSPPGASPLRYRARAAIRDEPIFIVLEYLAGGTLQELVAQRPLEVSAKAALEITRQLAAALDYLHLKGFVHMDVKGDNIVFRQPWDRGRKAEPVLVDFGVARRNGEEPLGGAIPYMAPERISGAHSALPSMDIYALGVVLFTMLAGRLPYSAADDEGLRAEICAGGFRPPSAVRQYDQGPHIVKRIDAIVLKALHVDPEQRPTAGQLVTELAAAAYELSIPLERPRSRRWVAVAAMGSVMAAGALLLAIVGPVTTAQPGSPVTASATAAAASTVDAIASASVTGSITLRPPAAAPVTTGAEPKATGTAPARPTAAPTATATAIANATPSETPIATPTATPTATLPPLPPPGVTGVTLLSPPDGAIITGPTTFSWAPFGRLPSNQAYIVGVWHPKEDCCKERVVRGLMAPTTDTSATVDLKQLVEDHKLNIPEGPNVEKNEDLNWGVFVVDRYTGQVLRYLGSSYRIRVE